MSEVSINKIHFKIGIFMLKKVFGFKKGPVKVGLQLTKKCNLDCIQCFAKNSSNSFLELNRQEIVKTLKGLRSIGSIFLVLTGGEPLLRNDIYNVVKDAVGLGFITALATNATLLTKDKAYRLKNCGLDYIHISLDGATAKQHDYFRGEGAFEKTIQGLRAAVSAKVSVCVTTTVTRQNKDNLEEIIELLIRENIKQWSPIFLVPCGQAKVIYPSHAIKEKNEILALMEKIYIIENKFKRRIKIYIHDPQLYFAYLLWSKKAGIFRKIFIWIRKGCGILNALTLYINSDGTIKPCAYFPDSLRGVNVKTHNIGEVFCNNEQLLSLRNKHALKGECRDCKFLFCCGGCRARIFINTGDFFAQEQNCPFFKKR